SGARRGSGYAVARRDGAVDRERHTQRTGVSHGTRRSAHRRSRPPRRDRRSRRGDALIAGAFGTPAPAAPTSRGAPDASRQAPAALPVAARAARRRARRGPPTTGTAARRDVRTGDSDRARGGAASELVASRGESGESGGTRA